jgi:hypothetical protein
MKKGRVPETDYKLADLCVAAGGTFVLHRIFKLANAITQAFAQTGQFGRTEEQESDDQNHNQVHGLHNAFKHEIPPRYVNSTEIVRPLPLSGRKVSIAEFSYRKIRGRLDLLITRKDKPKLLQIKPLSDIEPGRGFSGLPIN